MPDDEKRERKSRKLRTLRRRLIALQEEFDEFPQQLEQIRAVAAERDLDGLGDRIDEARRGEEGRKVPDDLYEELRRLLEKLKRLQRGDGDTYEYKTVWRKQIPLEFLIDILIEILEILRKLYARSIPRVEG